MFYVVGSFFGFYSSISLSAQLLLREILSIIITHQQNQRTVGVCMFNYIYVAIINITDYCTGYNMLKSVITLHTLTLFFCTAKKR